MEYRVFEVAIISAQDLKDVRMFRKMRVYAEVSVGGGPPQWTPPSERRCGRNPAWNCRMWFPVSEAMLMNHNAMLVVKLYCERMLGDRYVGEVHMPMKELFDSTGDTGGKSPESFSVLRGGANPQGKLTFAYAFGRKELYYGRYRSIQNE